MVVWISIVVFIIGICFWSFGSVLMTRLHDRISRTDLKGILWWRSKCFDTGRTLSRWELIPIVNFFVLRGKTHTSKKLLPRYYLALEIGTGLIFLITLWWTGQLLGRYQFDMIFWWTLVFWCLINRLLLVLIIRDIHSLTLHTPLRWVALAISLIPQFFSVLGNYQIAFYSSIVFWGGYLLIYLGAQRYMQWRTWTMQEGFGQGDIYIGFLIGTLMSFWFIDFQREFSIFNLFNLFIRHILLSSIIGLLRWGRYWIKERTINIKQMIPFFPAMILAFWILMIRK